MHVCVACHAPVSPPLFNPSPSPFVALAGLEIANKANTVEQSEDAFTQIMDIEVCLLLLIFFHVMSHPFATPPPKS